MSRFVKLTGTHGRPLHIAAEQIVSIEIDSAGGCFLAAGRTSYGVIETLPEILALLDAAPEGEGEVTDEATMAAINYLGQVYPRLTKNLALLDMQAAIEDALRVMRGQR